MLVINDTNENKRSTKSNNSSTSWVFIIKPLQQNNINFVHEKTVTYQQDN